ncbi:hypothetical protein OG607_41140 [Streptomyces sp. NBC_01537]|uniref:hypothetical protein n=1 Tax=Streptomyces sp. NBC_01537 TaxID=2903896 RepID=UPI0038687FC7
MPDPTRDDAPTPEHIRGAVHTLTQVTAYLHTNPPLADVLPLLTPLLDEYDGILLRLSQTFRELGHYLDQDVYAAHDINLAEAADYYYDAAAVLKQWSALDWPIPILRALAEQPHPATEHRHSGTDGACR